MANQGSTAGLNKWSGPQSFTNCSNFLYCVLITNYLWETTLCYKFTICLFWSFVM